jgi:hypothetical protein
MKKVQVACRRISLGIFVKAAVVVTMFAAALIVPAVDVAGAKTYSSTVETTAESTTTTTPLKAPTVYQVNLEANLNAFPEGTYADFVWLHESSCVRMSSEITKNYAQFFTEPGNIGACSFDKSYSRYQIFVHTPTGQEASRIVNVEQTSSPNIYFISFKGFCDEGSLQCSGNDDTVKSFAEKRAVRMVFTLGPLPTLSDYTFCSSQNVNCAFTGPKEIAYGADKSFVYKKFNGGPVACTDSSFGRDPSPGKYKDCFVKK